MGGMREGVWGAYVAGYLDGTNTDFSLRIPLDGGMAFRLNAPEPPEARGLAPQNN